MSVRLVLFILTIVGAAGTATSARAAAASQPADLCVQQAASNAFATLTTRLLRLPMTDRETVSQWIGGRTDVELALRRAAYDLRQVRVLSVPGAQVCRVEVSVAVSEMARNWARVLRQASVAPAEELEQIRRWSTHAEQGRLSASGTAERVDAAASRPASPLDETDQPPMPAGWEHLPPAALGLARRAAAADAAERLRARCRDMQLGTGETLGDVFDLYGSFEDAFLEQAQRRVDVEPVYEPFGVCRMPVRLSLKDIAAILSKAAVDVPKSAGLPRMEFTQLTDPSQRGTVSVEGVGAPPPPRLAWPGRSPANEAPTWATETLTAVGQGLPTTDMRANLDAAGRRQAAIDRARLDAIRNMWLQVDELMLPNGRRAHDVILAHPEIAGELAALEVRMGDAGPPELNEDGRASVKLTMPLAPLWDVLSRVVNRSQPAGPATKPARRATSEPFSNH